MTEPELTADEARRRKRLLIVGALIIALGMLGAIVGAAVISGSS